MPSDAGPHSLEDPRFFHHNGKLYISYTVSLFPAKLQCTVQYAELMQDGPAWRLGQRFQVKYGKNDFTAMEKNWAFLSHGGKLYCVYRNHPERIVLEIEGDRVVNELRSPALTWRYGEIRGGTEPLPYGDDMIQFCHSRTHNGKKHEWWRYYTLAVVTESKPPFRMLKISGQPIFAGHEWKPHDCWHSKNNVVIPYGAVAHGEGFLVSGGLNDAVVFVAEINKEQLRL
jgi:predicted GH43/DUF377 family glycosyl hydrolase